jgi:hypothetical protein
MMTMLPKDVSPFSAPTVFAVGTEYQIIAEILQPVLFWVRIGEEDFYDASNGIMNSMSSIHRVSVPMETLNAAKGYTICIRPIIERKPYFTETADVREWHFDFRPVPEKNARAYHLADCHNLVDEPIRAARTFGEIDFLILNGDVIDHSGSPDKFAVIYQICAALTGGQIPVVFARGNHDLRGEYAERFIHYTPHQRGNTYYTFRLGSIWGVILDCGEDKPDDHPEYGFTVACHAFRLQQTRFLLDLIRHADTEYNAPGITTRLVISHVPFPEKHESPFDIEEDVYRRWCELLRTHTKPHLMLCGHTHALEIRQPGHGKDNFGQPCSLVVGSARTRDGYLAGCGYVFQENSIGCIFTDCEGACLAQNWISLE